MNKVRKSIFIYQLLILMLMLSYQKGFSQQNYDPNTTEELRIRGGLPNFFAKIATDKTVTVGYVGGSITNQEGWRPKSFSWLEKQYPKTSFKMINAAVPGTGADFGNCRLTEALLSNKPDLVFIEYRVNGSGGFGVRAYEGLVRQIWKVNPSTDICFVYTIGENMITSIKNGLQHGEGKHLDKTANYYNIPSIDFGVEVVKQLQNGNFIFNGKAVKKGVKVFAKDAVHPTDSGHQLYSEIVGRSFLAMDKSGVIEKHLLLKPMEENNFENAALVSITNATLSSGWKKVDAVNDTFYKGDPFRTSQMLNEAVKCNVVGETISIEWEGKLICFTTIPLEEATEVEVVIDGGNPQKFDFKQKIAGKKFAQFFYAKELEDGKHKAVLTVTKLAKGDSFYCGQFLVIDTPKTINN